jgi:GTPase SAR1 family protein
MSPSIKLILVGTKSDMEQNRMVPYEEGKKMARKYNIEFVEVSAKTGDHVDNCFVTLASLIYNIVKDNPYLVNANGNASAIRSGQALSIESTSDTQRKGCCIIM